jgi:hypothetical protein
MFEAGPDELSPAADVGFREKLLESEFNHAFGDSHAPGDFLVRKAGF